MRYCTLADLQLAIPAQTLVWLSNDDSEAAAINEAVVSEAVTQAEELVDAHLRGRYNLPLEPVPSAVKNMTVNLARHWLYARRPEGSDLPDAVTRTYKSAMQMLESIRDGKLTIGAPTGEATPEPGEMKMRANQRVFSTKLLERY
ncbi:MAG: conserved phage protein [Burkholderiaceae bacterium]|nr:conserved phage protein [Burkholderiaceae bacterium]